RRRVRFSEGSRADGRRLRHDRARSSGVRQDACLRAGGAARIQGDQPARDAATRARRHVVHRQLQLSSLQAVLSRHAGGGRVGLLSISCFELLREGVTSLLTQTSPHAATDTELALVCGTILINAFVVAYESRQGKRLQSQILLADVAHTRSDILVTLLAVVSL